MFAIVASSFALAVYMVKLLKELVECLRSHLSVPSTEVRGRGPVSRRHRAPRRTTPERPESGYALGFAARASAFFQGRASGPEQRPRTMPSVLGKAVQEDSTSVSRQNAEQPSERFLLSKTPALLRAKTVVPVSRLDRDPGVCGNMDGANSGFGFRYYCLQDWWILDILLIVIRIYARRWALVHAYRLLRGLGFESYGIRPGSAATWFHRRWPERVARGSYFSTLQRWGRTGIPYWTEAAIMLIAAEMTEIIFKIVVVVLNGR
ncbi:uncharacterized protein [Dermacentor andersoni]|uniref:uncharacterized protein isoform X2 n=1 Tax=Dermacentor andersoni TaxID=34620 RepID=UPI0024170265|nr:uncharacterized protein LOC129382271 isoform X2 [Dermacentor andersoni]